MDWINDECVFSFADANMTETDMWNDITCGKRNKRIAIEFILATLIVDGLSRFGSGRQFNVAPALQDWSLPTPPPADNYYNTLLGGVHAVLLSPDPDLVRLNMSVTIDGYAYCASTATDYLSTAFVRIYLLIASTHVI